MNSIHPALPRLTTRVLAVAFTVLAILVISLCASVMAVIYIHADEHGLVPQAWSLSNQVTQPVITVLPPPQPESESPQHKAPRYQI